MKVKVIKCYLSNKWQSKVQNLLAFVLNVSYCRHYRNR